jgi:hypothetical protein
MAIAPMLAHNRESAAQPRRERDCLGRFTAVGAVQGQGPSLVRIAKQIAAEHNVGESTIWNWRRQYRAGGYAALARRRRADSGRSAFFRHHPEVLPAIDARLRDGLSPFAAWKSLRWACRFAPPSYEVVLNYARGRYSLAGQSPSAGSAATL